MSQTSIFTQVRTDQAPGELLYQDDVVFVILSIAPHNPGHCLIIPVEEVANIEDLSESVYAHLMKVARQLSQALKALYVSPKVGLMVVGLSVPHTHLHVFPLYQETDVNTDKAHLVAVTELAPEAEKIRKYLKEHPLT